MIKRNIVPVFPNVFGSISENLEPAKFPDFLLKIGHLIRTALATVLLLHCSVQSLQARHKCYKVPAPPGVVGIISIPILIPSGSTMAIARSSETSGCANGHPSENFYKPKSKRVALFLKDNLTQVREESAQGQGVHLEALAKLAGCSLRSSEFGRIIQNNYSQVFGKDIFLQIEKNSKNNSKQTTERLLNLMEDSSLLASSCESG